MTVVPRLSPRSARVPAVIVGLLLALPGPASAASKALVAAIGDAAPGGGVFAGPGFTGWPSAAGNGWVAFRGQITGGQTTEAIVVAHMTAPASRSPVASLGQPAPSAGIFGKCTGKLKQFLGQPVVNANGDVAFMALIEPPASTGTGTGTIGPIPAGIFALRGGQLVPIACSGQPTAGGILDLVAVLDVFSNPNIDVADRSPSMNDGGDVAFLTGYVTDQGLPAGGAVVVAPRAGGYTEVARIDGPFGDGKFQSFGPPILNNHGVLAFHGIATDPSDSNGLLDGVIIADASGLNAVVRDGLQVMPAGNTLTEFQDTLSLNDSGDVAFLAGPVTDPSDNSIDPETPGVLLYSAGAVTVLAYGGEHIGGDKITGVTLGPNGGSAVATPSIAPDGTVAFFAALNGGNGEAILRWDGHIVLPVVFSGGNGADATPVGGTYAGTESAPALDAGGGLVFLARIAGGTSSQAIIYRAADGTYSPIVIGEAAPRQNDGFFGGRPFSTPHLNDAGDVVFRSFIASGPSSVGVFRLRGGKLSAVVRTGDPAPLGNGPPFIDLPGEPSVNTAGSVVFTGDLAVQGRGIYLADQTGIHALVLRGDHAPGDAGAVFTILGTNAQINDAGVVAFRGTASARDPVSGVNVKRDGIFIRDGNGIHAMVYAAQPSPEGLPFLKLRDPALMDVPTVVFRAPLGVSLQQSDGIFFADATGTSALAMDQQDLGGGVVITSFSGDPSVAAGGHVAFVALRARPITPGGPAVAPLGPAILTRRGDGGLDLVTTQGAKGPLGGTFKAFGQPAINASGHVLFRGSFNALTGGTSGLYLFDGAALEPYTLRGEVSSLGGRLSAFGAQPSFNANDEAAFSAQVNGGKARSALFVASPTTLATRLLALRLSKGKGHDRVALRAVLTLGRVSDGVHPAKEAVTVSLSDTQGTLWSASVPAKHLKGAGRSWSFAPKASKKARSKKKTAVASDLSGLQLLVGKSSVRVNAASAAVDLTHGGLRPLAPPFTVRVEVGDDEGSVTFSCAPGPRGGHCRS